MEHLGTPEDQAHTLEYVERHRAELKRAHDAVVRSCRGLLMGGQVRLGYDHTRQPPHQWWAEVKLQGGRAGVEVLEQGHASGLAALEALAPRIHRHVRQVVGARRRR
jgi:hypothetical protein